MRNPSKVCGSSWVAAAFVLFAVTLAVGQSVTVTPTSLSFSNQVLSTPSSVQTVTLQNGLTTALKISKIATSLSDYSETNTCPLSPSTLAAGTTCIISVTFTPGALGVRSGSLKITDNASNSPQSMTLTGTGIAAVTAAPASLAFGNQAIGLESSASPVTVTNSQTTALTIKSITSSLGDYTTTTTCPLTPSTLAAGGSCTVSVFFTPAAAGSRKGTLTISDNASNSPTVSLTGTGVIAATTNPTSLSFSSQALGTTSAAKTVTLTNNQSASLTIGSVTSSVADFGVSSACPATLAGGANCKVSVTFSPKAMGTRSGTLTFSDSANNSPQTVSLSGTGAAANLVSIAVTPAPASIALGTTQQFAATGTYSDGTTKTLTSSVKWTSTAATVASVNSSGLATSLAQGTTTITATSGTVAGSSTLTVTAPALTSIAVTPATASIPLGTSQPFTAIGTYSNKSTQNVTSSVSWSSSSAGIASVSNSGLASGNAQGSATITAAFGTISGSASLNVAQPALVSIAITPSNASFALGTTQALKAIGTYTDGSTLDISTSVSWNTANSGIATVSGQGLATSVAVGGTSVTATLGSISGTTTLTVNPATLVSIAITPAIPAIPLGTTVQFSATGTFTDGSTQNVTDTVQWSSDTTSVATISNSTGSQGIASSVATGTANITATSGSVQGTTTLTVTTAALISIAVTPASPTIALGTTQQLVATGTFTDGTTQNLTATATWSSDTQSTATINGSGLASSVAVGTTTISATANNITGSTLLSVTPAQLVSIAVSPPATNIPLGTTQVFTALGTYTDGTTQDVTQAGHWSSTNAAAATISNTPGSQGLASTLGTGTTTIGIALGSVNGTATLTVNPAALVTITLSPQTPTIALGTTQQFTASGTYTDGSVQDLTATVQWTSSSAMVAVMNATGLATSAGTGTATITAMLGTVTASTTLTVGPAAIVSLTISPSTATISLGMTQQFQAIATYTDGTTQDLTASATWTSSSPGVAAVSTTGLASSLSSGTTTISANSGGASGGSVLAVTPAVPVSLAVSPTTASIAFGAQQQFQALLTYSDGSIVNVSTLVTWSSSANTVATVGSTGLASSVGAGTTTIYASASNGLIVGSALSVSPPSLISIAVTPANPTLALSSSQQFVATGTYADNSTQNLTVSVSWASSNSSVVSVSSSGLGTALQFGSSTITATSGSISGSAAVTVPTTSAIPASLFDMTINKTTTPWPVDTFYGQRLLGTGTLWGDLETANGTYNWTVLNKFVSNGRSPTGWI